ADDWTHIKASAVAKRAISRVEARRKGILLLHDIQPATALAFPEILHELKVRGYKIVHVVPATPDRPKTVSMPEQWVARQTPEQKVWPRLVSVGAPALSNDEPALEVPSAASLGLSNPLKPVSTIALVPSFDRPILREGEIPLPPVLMWPRQRFAAPHETEQLPAPAAQTFKYSRVFQMPGTEKKKKAPAAPGTQVAKPKDTGPATTGQTASATTRSSGHQLSVVRPPLSISLPNFMR